MLHLWVERTGKARRFLPRPSRDFAIESGASHARSATPIYHGNQPRVWSDSTRMLEYLILFSLMAVQTKCLEYNT